MFYFYGFSILNSFSTVYLRKIFYYSVASTSDAAFVIGGRGPGTSDFDVDVIAKFENDKWSPNDSQPYGNLRKRRNGHGSITYGTQTMVIGGWTVGS